MEEIWKSSPQSGNTRDTRDAIDPLDLRVFFTHQTVAKRGLINNIYEAPGMSRLK